MTEQVDRVEIAYRTELVRKAIHLCALIIPATYYFVTKEMALVMLLPATAFFIIIDVGRYYNPLLQQWFYTFFGWLLRQHETDAVRKRLNGATFVLISATLCVLIFPKPIMITSFCILVVGDLMAALIGRRFGRHRFFRKSVEGSLAFFVSGTAIIFVIPNVASTTTEYILAIAAVAVGAVVEALPWDVDDNFSIPLSVGAVLWIGELLLRQ